MVYSVPPAVLNNEEDTLNELKRKATLSIEHYQQVTLVPEPSPAVVPDLEELPLVAVASSEQESHEVSSADENPVNKNNNSENFNKVSCNDCGLVIESKSDLEQHSTICLALRGTKRQRPDTSLLLEPAKPCSVCDESMKKMIKAQEEHSLTQTAYTEVKLSLEETMKELHVKTDELENIKKEMATLTSKISNENSYEEAYRSLMDEHEIVKKMVLEKDTVVSKLKENYEKEIQTLKLAKSVSDEALNCATRENTAMKDKENTLIDIFKSMKMYIESSSKEDNDNKSTDKHSDHDSQNSEVKVVECDHCEFKDKKEENVINHNLAVHSNFKCHLCDFVTTSGESLDKHLTNEHFKPQFICSICDSSFHTERMLKDHARRHRRDNSVKCDFCNFESSAPEVQRHIDSYHKIVDKSRQSSYNPDKRIEQSVKTYTLEEKIRHGPCMDWNETECRNGDLCRYAHIKICKFQERCRSHNDCHFYHFNHSNLNFLRSMSFRRGYRMNYNEFPRPHNQQRASRIHHNEFPRFQSARNPRRGFRMNYNDFPPLPNRRDHMARF